MNILILTGRFGLGHVKAAEAIRETILAENPACRVNIVDFAEYWCPAAADLVYDSFTFLTSQCSGLYNRLNHGADRLGKVPCTRLFLRKIHHLLTAFHPDAIIVTMPFLGQYVSACLTEFRFRIPLYTCITDVTFHRGWIASACTHYFVASQATRLALLSCGIPSFKITVSGVPVRQSFRQRPISHPRSSLTFRILVMGGGLGILPASGPVLKSLAALPDTEVTVICGRNRKLAARLRREYPSFTIIGYTNQVADHMGKAHLLLTKAGGVTLFEAIAVRTPLLVFPPFLEQEKENARFIQDTGIGRILEEGAEEEILRELCSSRQTLQTMASNMARLEDGWSSISRVLVSG